MAKNNNRSNDLKSSLHIIEFANTQNLQKNWCLLFIIENQLIYITGFKLQLCFTNTKVCSSQFFAPMNISTLYDYGLSKTFNQTYKICLFLFDAVCKFIALFQFLILEGFKNTHRNICLDVCRGSFLVMT